MLIQEDRQYTRSEVDLMARSIGAWLAERGIQPGDRVGVAAQNSIDVLVAGLGIDCAGAIGIMMPSRATASDLAHLIRDAGARIIFVDEIVATELSSAAEVEPLEHVVGLDCPALQVAPGVAFHSLSDVMATPVMPSPKLGGNMVFYTAGTTGPAKGVYRDGAQLSQAAAAFTQVFEFQPTDTHLAAGPLYHGGPAQFARIAVALGNRVVVLRSFDPEVLLRLVERERVTTSFMVPTMLRLLTKHPSVLSRRYDTSSMRMLITAGEPCPMPLKRDVMDLFGPVLHEFGGASELGILAVMPPEGHELKPGSCGRILPGQEIAIVDGDGNKLGAGEQGEILVRSAALMTGYWNDAGSTDALQRDGYMSLGDVGYVDEDNYLYITGRVADLIKSGGVRITPSEVESVLLEHAAVLEAAVVGAIDEKWGERVVACVLTQPSAAVTAEDIQLWCRSHLAPYKVPKQVVFFAEAEWPRQGTGKVPKRILRQLVMEEHDLVEDVGSHGG